MKSHYDYKTGIYIEFLGYSNQFNFLGKSWKLLSMSRELKTTIL
jgi:hypothetical protein